MPPAARRASTSPTAPRWPLRLAAALLRALLPIAELDEVLNDLQDEYAHRRIARGRATAAVWLWLQVLGSAPALLRRSWWRGWTGFEPAASRMTPGGPGMESWIMELRYSVRRLSSRPTYVLIAVLGRTSREGMHGAPASAQPLRSTTPASS